MDKLTHPRGQVEPNGVRGHSRQQHQRVVPLRRLCKPNQHNQQPEKPNEAPPITLAQKQLSLLTHHLRWRTVPPEREPPLGARHGRVVQLVGRAYSGLLRHMLASCCCCGGGRGGGGDCSRLRGRGGRRRGAGGGERAEPRRWRARARGGAGGPGGGEMRDGGSREEGAELGRVRQPHGIGLARSFGLGGWDPRFWTSGVFSVVPLPQFPSFPRRFGPCPTARLAW